MLILPPPPSLRFGMLCSQLAWVRPRMSTISPLARGSLSGFSEGGAALLFGCWWGGLCFRRKSRGAPMEREAIDGLGPRKRSSSLWYEMLSAPVA